MRRSLRLTLSVKGSDLSVTKRVMPVWNNETEARYGDLEISDGEVEEMVLMDTVKEAKSLVEVMVRTLWKKSKAEQKRLAQQPINQPETQ